MTTLRDRWSAAARLLVELRPVLEDRPDLHALHDVSDDRRATDSPWSTFLLGLADDTLEAIEGAGVDAVWPVETPATLRALLARIRTVIDLPMVGGSDDDADRAADHQRVAANRRHERPRKQAQIDAFVRAVRPLHAHTQRFVDVGSGHGHLTRAVATALLRPAVGLEYNPVLVKRANDLAAADNDTDGNAHVFFVERNVLNDGLDVVAGDCLIGLHACGELGDLVVRAARHCDHDVAIAFVGCCLQKQRALLRTSLCVDDDGAAVVLPKDLLGLSNLNTHDDGVEASRTANIAARARRLAVRLLLERAGVDVAASTELRGVNRRAAHEPLPDLVARVFAWRGLAIPDDDAIAAADVEATQLHARARRLAVPRQLLARVLEIFVLLDRALFLQAHGFTVVVGELFSTAVSPRNLILVARRPGPPASSALPGEQP